MRSVRRARLLRIAQALLRARFNEEKKKKSNFLSLIELTLNLIGQKMNNQEDISIFGRGKFDSIHLTKKSKKTKRPTFELD